jgi:hypothetical protein
MVRKMILAVCFFFVELPDRFNAVEPRHGDIDYNDIGLKSERLLHKLVAVFHNTDHLVLRFKDIFQAFGNKFMVIGEENFFLVHHVPAWV